jgi:uncharacterized coiled-coil protein SlyX
MNMIGEYDIRIKELCQLASQEQDSQKLNALVTELIHTFEKKEKWLQKNNIRDADESQLHAT